LGHLSEAAATALARAVSFRRAGHDDLAQMAGHLSADTVSALGHRRDISARRRAALPELDAQSSAWPPQKNEPAILSRVRRGVSDP
jgi:hypothetical protein